MERKGERKGRDGITEVGGDGEIEGQDRKRKGRWERVKEEGREGGKEGSKAAREEVGDELMLSAGLAKISARGQNGSCCVTDSAALLCTTQPNGLTLTNQPGMHCTHEVSTENPNEKCPGNKSQP